MIVAVPAIKAGEGYIVSPHFGRAPFFLLAEISGSSYKVLEVLRNEYTSHQHGRGVSVTELLKSRGVEAVIALGVGPGAFTYLKEAGVAVYYVPQEAGLRVPVEKALELFAQGRLERAHEAREFD